MKADIAFVHPPSIYDFRKKILKEGPIGDVVPSTPLFEMYPVGFVSMLNHAIKNGYSGRICNLAVLMLSDRKFDVERYLKRVDADVFGIDLHWLPHVHGAFNIARIIKRIHPNSKILLGGFSASYFAEEILHENKAVDFVLAGDFVENQLLSLLAASESNRDLSKVPNLVYRDGDRIRKNAVSLEQDPAKDVFINYAILVRNSIKYNDIKGHFPYLSWIENPMGMTIVQRGCQFNCGFCGGSNYAYHTRYFPVSPVRRDPARVAEEIEVVKDTINAPTFIAGDLCQTGEEYYTKFFREIRERGIDLPLLTEYFVPPDESYFETLSRHVNQFMCEISPDSSNERIRKETGRSYSNSELEKSIDYARKYGSRKFDIYFSIGLPYQTGEDVLADADYTDAIIQRHGSEDMPIYGFIAPLAPFIDPGSLFYEFPERYGFTVKTKRIMDYYNLLENGNSWEDFLNYETKWMSKKEMVEATYLSGMRMVEVGSNAGYIQLSDKRRIINNILSYMNGQDYQRGEDKSRHLTYMIKEIEWSKKHGITPVSIAVFAYSIYERIRRAVLA